MKTIVFLIITILVTSCTYNIKTVEHKSCNKKHVSEEFKVKQTVNYIDSQRALANMAMTWTQEERDAFKRDFFYTENDLSCVDSLLKK